MTKQDMKKEIKKVVTVEELAVMARLPKMERIEKELDVLRKMGKSPVMIAILRMELCRVNR